MRWETCKGRLSDDHHNFVPSFVSSICKEDSLDRVCFLCMHLSPLWLRGALIIDSQCLWLNACSHLHFSVCSFCCLIEASYILFIRLAHCGAGGKVMHDCF